MSPRRGAEPGHEPARPPASPAAPVKLLDFRSVGWIMVLSVLLMIAFAWQLVWPVIQHSRKVTAVEALAPASNGFDLTTCLIPREQIIRSVPRDHIPALTNPPTLAGSQVDAFNKVQYKFERKFLVSGDRVIGITLGGESRAYPLSVMNWHEVVNDTLGGTPICVTYNPLGDSAVVFSRERGGQVLEFGVSGLLYNSNLLMYDRQRENQAQSLWSQLEFRAISGPAAQAGAVLQVLPIQLTQWADWYARNPQTSVLLGDKQLLDRYNANPYSNYYEVGKLRFPVDPLPPAAGLPPFARVLALQQADGWHVYPCDELIVQLAGGNKLAYHGVSFSFVPLSAALDPACIWATSANGSAEDPAVYCLWFAWHAAHPDVSPPAPGAQR